MAPPPARVHRAVRTGGIVMIVAALQFILITVLSAQYYPNFSWSTTHVTSLGEPASPWNLLFNASLIALGLLMILGILLIWSAFPSGAARGGGLGLLLISSAASIGVGLTPGVTSNLHIAIAEVIFVAAGVGFLLLAYAMSSRTSWAAQRGFYIFLGVATLVAYVLLFDTNLGWNQYPGAFGLVAIGLVLLWDFQVGGYLVTLKTMASPRPRLVHG